MWKRISSLLLLLIILFTQTGCWDRFELEDLAYVIAIGIDLAPDGSNDRIVTVNIAIPAKLAGGGGEKGGGDKTFFAVSARSRDFYTAMDLLQAAIVRRLNLLQCRAIYVGEKFARELGVLPMTRIAARHPELRRDVVVVVVNGEAEKLLKSDYSPLETNVVRYYDAVLSSNEFTGYSSISTFHKFMEGMESPGQNSIVALVGLNKEQELEKDNRNPVAGEVQRKGGKPADYIGLAAFRSDKMVGKLGKEEAEITNILRDDWIRGPYEFPDPMESEVLIGGDLGLDRSPEVIVNIDSEPVTINVKVRCSFHLVSETGSTNYTLPENRVLLEQALKADLENRAKKVIARAQTEFSADIFRFGSVGARKHFRTWKEWEDFRWAEKFQSAQIQVSAEVKVQWFGLQGAPPQAKP